MRFDLLLSAHASRTPDRIAVIAGDRRLSFSELARSARRFAGGLQRMGVQPGDRVAIHLPNGIEFLQAYYGVLYAGATVLPVSTWLTLHEVRHCCEDSQAKIIVLEAGTAENAAVALRGLDIRSVVVDGSVHDGDVTFASLIDGPAIEPSQVRSDVDECLILYTSGTTGKPKGAVLTHDNLLIPAGFVSAIEWGLSSDDCFLVAAPLSNRTGIGRITNAITLGAPLVIMRSFDPEAFVDLIDRESISAVGLVPTMCRRLLPVLERRPGSCTSLRVILVTGEAFPADLKARMIAALPNVRLISYFGMTECGAVTRLDHHEQFTHPKSVGRPSLGVDVAILGPDDRVITNGEIGELVIRGRPGSFNIMKGYFNRPDATAEALKDGWFRTGDLAWQDPNDYLYIVDRKKDMIVSGGFNIYSKEVEEVVSECAGVAASAVVGVPDESFGEAVVLFIEQKHGEPPPSPDEVLSHCRERLAAYKKPRHIFIVESLPRSTMGKVLKRDLVDDAKERLGADSQATTN